ncbi:SDR family oxidoreductase [Virgibacillus sp. NKC19-16]|uniref:SDR family NAD(P)-dependent oxidoreductase n=1 Tax=Virgibacillus salidurans TaxID=2831673 RepID=UPI001F3DB57A|nr:SDR family oxidoreductase [Virgibacillus sp. NKC19-16]UJL45483.1 SDR family oxidoreductase [Virgibacillus sp. NKC19-16]
MYSHFNGKNILVTGSAKGIGRGIALALAESGANVAIHYLGSSKEAEQTTRKVKEIGVNTTFVQGDISNFDDVQKMKEALDRDFGKINYIVNNAGWTQVKPFFQYEPDEWQKEIDICLNGVLNLAYVFMPEMIEDSQGKFINIIGDSARTGDRHLIVSGAARNGAVSFMKSLAKEVGRNGIQCNTVSLGMIDQGEFDETMKEKLVKQYPLKKLGSRDDVAGMVLFLLSNNADWVTGQVFSVNGGHSMLG